MQKIFWFLLLATVVWGAIMQVEMAGYVKQPSRFGTELPPDCANKKTPPIAQIELSKTSACFASLIGPMKSTSPDATADGPENLRLAVRNTHEDYAFITLYWLTFLAFAWVLGKTDPRTRWLGAAVAILITVAAGLDLRENQLMLAGFCQIKEGNLNFVTSGVVSTVKWCVFGAATTALGIHCFVAEKLRLRKVIGGLLAVSGLLTLVGTLACKNPIPIGLFIAMPIALVSYFPWRRPKGKVVATFLIYAYLLRFPIINGLLLAVVLPAGYFYAPSIFYGLFDAMVPFSFFLICFAAFLLAIIIMITARITLAYAPDRFDDVSDTRPWVRSSWWPTILFSLLAVPMVVMTWRGSLSDPFSAWLRVAGVVLAALAALAFLYATAQFHAWLEETAGSNTVCFIYPPFRGLNAHGAPPNALSTGTAEAMDRVLPGNLDAGYIRQQIVGGKTELVLRSGHRVGTIALIATLLIYAVVGYFTSPSSRISNPAAMFYVLLLLCLLTWFFSGVAFFLDKLRVPVLTAVLGISMVLAAGWRTDHVFELHPLQSVVSVQDPSHVIDAWANFRKREQAPIVVVATAGGGIRASAWTTEVLTGLADDCESADGTQNAFTSSVVLISSVSGGSEGAMYFAGWYDGNGNTDPKQSGTIFDESARTDLGAVGWGLVYPDLLRTVPGVNFLVPQNFDRGSALEREWVTHWKSHAAPPQLSEWNDDVGRGTRPAVIFNATISETGNRFMAATTGLYEQPAEGRPAALQFFPTFTKEDMDVSTAARVSATFPFVSPMSRPDTDLKYAQLHLGDGGYYDNSGLLSALQWLMGAGPKLKGHPVYLVIIDAMSSEKSAGGVWSWQRQIVAPVGTLLAVRTSSQETRADIELHATMDDLGFNPEIQDKIKPVYFHYSADDRAPLSWHLLRTQREDIVTQWKSHQPSKYEPEMLQDLHCSVAGK
ncbi:MAG TPA: hypothetical protein VGU25_11330 [Acidobacteriaceae bacterium]|nr:hypothetical protein [Acidobacteriaceae bacterium]